MIQGIATVEVYVEDQDTAHEFSHNWLGFQVRRRELVGDAGTLLEVAPQGLAAAW